MKDLYSLTLDKAQIAKLCEEYALSRSGDRISLTAKAELDPGQKSVIVRVSTKRVRKEKAK